MTTSMMKRLYTSAALTVLLGGALLAPFTTHTSRVQAAASHGLTIGCSSAPQVCLSTLTASAYSVLLNNSVTLSVTTNVDITKTPWYVAITNETGALVKRWGSGTSFAVTVSSSTPAVHTYYVSIQNSSGQTNATDYGNQLVVFRPGPCTGDQTGTVCLNSLTASSPQPAWNQSVTLTASASKDVGLTVYYIRIVDDTGAVVANCGTGTTCSATLGPQNSHIYTAYLSYDPNANTDNASAPSILVGPWGTQ